jgi:hypothetical protein
MLPELGLDSHTLAPLGRRCEHVGSRFARIASWSVAPRVLKARSVASVRRELQFGQARTRALCLSLLTPFRRISLPLKAPRALVTKPNCAVVLDGRSRSHAAIECWEFLSGSRTRWIS